MFYLHFFEEDLTLCIRIYVLFIVLEKKNAKCQNVKLKKKLCRCLFKLNIYYHYNIRKNITKKKHEICPIVLVINLINIQGAKMVYM